MAREIFGRLMWTIRVSRISKPIRWQLLFAKHFDRNQCWHQCKRGHRKLCMREDLDANDGAKRVATQLQEIILSCHTQYISCQIQQWNNTDRSTTVVSGTRNGQLEDIFQFELCRYPQAIFESRYVMRPANKPVLADAIWVVMPKDVVEPTGQSQYVLDGGSLVHRIPWQRGTTYNDIM